MNFGWKGMGWGGGWSDCFLFMEKNVKAQGKYKKHL